MDPEVGFWIQLAINESTTNPLLCVAVGKHNNHSRGIRAPGGDSMQLEKQSTQQEQQPIEKSNQHTNLTRFGNVPTSSGQGRERFY